MYDDDLKPQRREYSKHKNRHNRQEVEHTGMKKPIRVYQDDTYKKVNLNRVRSLRDIEDIE